MQPTLRKFPGWQEQVVRRLGLEYTVRREGHPSRQAERETGK